MPHLSFSRRRLGASMLLSILLLGCDDPTAPNAELAKEFDRLAARAETASHPRDGYLRAIAQTLRRGAPVNKLTLTVNGVAREYNAVAIEWGFSSWALTTTVLGWRGEGANELFQLSMHGDTLVTYRVTVTPEDSAVYIGNLGPPDMVDLTRDTTDLWSLYAGDGDREIVSEGSSCHALTSSHTCQSVDIAIRLDVTTFLVGTASYGTVPPDQQSVVASRTQLRGIRYQKVCPEPTGTSTSCFVSLITEGQ